MVDITQGIALALFLGLLLGPWTPTLYTRLGVCEFGDARASTMVYELLGKVGDTFGANPSFLLVPFAFLLLRAFCPQNASLLQSALVLLAYIVSIVSLPVLLIQSGRARDVAHPMGDVLVGDALTWSLAHAVLVVMRKVPAWTFVCGPLFGLCYVLRMVETERPSSYVAGIGMLYLNIGCLYRAYRTMASEGHAIFVQTLGIEQWDGIELYSATSVIGGFVVICSSLPPPPPLCKRTVRGVGQLLETFFYVVLLNANVGAAAIASSGILRIRS